MHVKSTAHVFALATCVLSTPAFASSHGQSGAVIPHGAPTTTAKTTAPTAKTTTSVHTNHAKTSGPTGTAPTGTAPTGTTPTATTPPVRLNPIAAKIASKPQLNSRITAMLPKGMTLNSASAGFKNQGQFIAALHVSQNLGCDCFRQIKADMTRRHMSLGQAIQDVKKTSNTSVEAHRAETEADEDIRHTAPSTPTSATPSPTSTTPSPTSTTPSTRTPTSPSTTTATSTSTRPATGSKQSAGGSDR